MSSLRPEPDGKYSRSVSGRTDLYPTIDGASPAASEVPSTAARSSGSLASAVLPASASFKPKAIDQSSASSLTGAPEAPSARKEKPTGEALVRKPPEPSASRDVSISRHLPSASR